MQPHVFRGLWCRCGERHTQEASYYVSVTDGGPDRAILALGPFQEHGDALAHVNAVNVLVQAKYPANGRAHFYGFGTTAMRPSYRMPGKLNALMLSRNQTQPLLDNAPDTA